MRLVKALKTKTHLLHRLEHTLSAIMLTALATGVHSVEVVVGGSLAVVFTLLVVAEDF